MFSEEIGELQLTYLCRRDISSDQLRDCGLEIFRSQLYAAHAPKDQVLWHKKIKETTGDIPPMSDSPKVSISKTFLITRIILIKELIN